jgi:DNA helicase-2/ATP-dependent DNA helicase PcrA
MEASNTQQISDNHVDDHVDDEIKLCLSEANHRSFFMFAGAGSGKTRSLINALTFIDNEMGLKLSTHFKQVAVITYTNAACDEISKRLQYKQIFAVSTIHSFLWGLIESHQRDIKNWVIESLNKDIAELRAKQSSGRGGDASIRREAEIAKKNARLAKIATIKKFSYDPNGENAGYDSLSHSEVVKMGSEFIATEETMQEILINKYPILLIDESQDTKKELVAALLTVYEKYRDRFVIGMFGDTMQRIYLDGKDNLDICIPDDWNKPVKVMNHRSSTRIVELANAIRQTIDGKMQRPRSDVGVGTVRLFIADASAIKEDVELRVAQMMAKLANDNEWLNSANYKSLILEHHMAASRFGFLDLYVPLHESKCFETSLLSGSIPELSFLANIVAPLIKAHQQNNEFEISRIVRLHSPLLSKKSFEENSANQTRLLEVADRAVEALLLLWDDGAVPTCIEVLESIRKTNLFTLNDFVDDILSGPIEDEDKKITALRQALSVPFDVLEKYSAYVTDNTSFITHQGVKGREFPRVMVIMDDSEARGFLFSYEKLFGVKDKTETDIRNEREGKDTGITRTTRLFMWLVHEPKKALQL